MNEKSFSARYINWSDKNFSKKWYIVLSCIFAPIFFLLEYISYKKIWENFILTEIGENEDFCKWLDLNEFGFDKKFNLITRIYKKDIIFPDDEKLSVYKTKDLEFTIYKEYFEAFIEKLEKYFQFDMENYVSLLCDVSLKRIGDTKEFMKIYEVSFVFYRYDRFIIALRTFKNWFNIFCVFVLIFIILLIVVF